MKKVILIASLFMFGACSHEKDQMGKIDKNTTEGKCIQSSALNTSIEKYDNMLKFDNYEDFKSLVSKINSVSSERGLRNFDALSKNSYGDMLPLPDITLRKEGFHSIYDDFVNAMNEAERFYDKPGGYEEFKEKYSMLYFPEEGDDFSAYLPVSDKNVAKLLNSKGEVMINGDILNLKDINSYKQLIDLGIAPIESSINSNSEYPLNRLPEVKCNGRKLWARAYSRPGTTPGVLQEIVIEVCFRKKGFMGAWYNYGSETTLGFEGGRVLKKSGWSSHDYLWARVYNGGPVPFQALVYVQFRGFGAKCGSEKYYFRVDV